MKSFFSAGTLILAFTFFALLGCSTETEHLLEGSDSESSITQVRTGEVPIGNETLRPFQITYEPGVTRTERRETRESFLNDPYTTFVDFISCGSQSDKEIWYMEVHPEHAPPACPTCSGPKTAASHIEDDGDPLERIFQVLEDVDTCD